MYTDNPVLTSPPIDQKGSIATKASTLHTVLLALRLESERTGPECHTVTNEAVALIEKLLEDCGYRIL